MSDSASSISGRLRITGMASGMDVDSMVKSLMKAESAKQDKLKQQQTYLQWTQDAYREQIGNIKSFYSKYFDVISSNNILSQSNFSGFNVTTTAGTNVTAKVSSSAVQGNYTVTVNPGGLAQKASAVGANYVNVKQVSSGTLPVTIVKGTNDTVNLNGKIVTLDAGSYSVSALASQINTKIAADADLKDKIKAVTTADGKNVRIEAMMKIDTNNNTFAVDDGTAHNITISAGTYSMDGLASQINAKLQSAGLDSKLKAVVSDDGSKIQYQNISGSNITVGGTTIAAGTTGDSSSYSQALSVGKGSSQDLTVNGSDNILKYDKVISAAYGNNQLTFNVNGSNVNVTLADTTILSGTSDSDAANQLAAAINNAINNAADPKLANIQADIAADGKGIIFKSSTGSQINLTGTGATALGMASSVSLNQTTDERMGNLVNSAVAFKVNGVDFSYDFTSAGANANMTVADVMNDISSKAGVNVTYSSLTRQFTMESKTTGAGQYVSASDTSGGLVSTLFGLGNSFDTTTAPDGDTNLKKGKDLTVSITEPGQSNPTPITQTSNTFTLDGVVYTINGEGETKFNIGGDPQKIVDKIKDFVTQYNSLVQGINDKISEKKQYTYKPLTDDQRSSMKDADITNWETKAKQGILSNDSDLGSMLSKMRMALYDTVSDAGISLSEIGISTSSDLSQNGQLVIDETKLKNAIENNSDKVMNLFTKKSPTQSTYVANDSKDADAITKRNSRYKEEGIFQRISDVMQDYTRTYNGKGTLLKKSGIKGDITEANNTLSAQLKEKLKAISDMNDLLKAKEDSYYNKFSQLETYMNQMNAQQSWLQGQISKM